VNFKNVMESARQKVPFGIAQIGKAFRNEINTKYFLFRTREFEQMEMQYFIKPGTHGEQFEYWREERYKWFMELGMSPEMIRFKPHDKLAHYAAAAVDIEFKFPFGWGEIEGIHSRTDFDLKRHEEFSGKKLEFVDTATKERFVPYVIETSVGASRSFMAFLCHAYNVESVGSADGGEDAERTVLKFHPKLAPVKAAVLPLVKKDGMPEFAENIYRDLQKSFAVQYDDSAAVGRRYRRQDEIGTPFCITVDGESLQNDTVTIRHRDSMQQERVGTGMVKEYVMKALL
jgi:glycyl-tRNA synthetase